MAHEATITRRALLTSAVRSAAGSALLAALLSMRARATAAPPTVTVYKDPSCGCCVKWIAHLRASGFALVVNDRRDMDALKDSMGVPVALRSCHTAVVGKYVIEGHVPASNVLHLLATAPKGILGLAAPGMPRGSPGMEMSGQSDHYDVIAFSANGTTSVFASHG